MSDKSETSITSHSPNAQWNNDAVQVVGNRPHRKVIAKRKLRRGEIILRESPTKGCVLLHAKEWGRRCHQCFSTPDKPLMRCSRCQCFYYCSKACQRQDWKASHRQECAAVASSALTPHEEQLLLVDALLVARIFRLEETNPTQYQAVMDLVFHEACIQPHHYETSDLVMRLGLVSDNRSQQDILELLARFDANNFGLVDELLFLHGTGVYPAAAMLNHSCHANCAIAYSGQNHQLMMIRCIVDEVQAGDELCHSYMDLALTSSQRRKKLQATYEFDCHCIRCVDAKGIWSQADAWLSSPAPGMSTAQANDAITMSEPWLQQAAMTDNVRQELHLVQQCVNARAKALHPRHLALYRARSQLHTTSMAAGEFELARTQCIEMVATMERCFYRPEHPMMGVMSYTLASLHHSLSEWLQAIDCYEKAIDILQAYHGRDHFVVVQCKDYLQQARAEASA